MTEKASFITEARRNQIMDAAIATLNEIGFVKTSLAQIAKRSDISTALISYHFANKTDLMSRLLEELLGRWYEYVLKRVDQQASAWAKLEAFITSSLAYQVTSPVYHTALIEIIFNAQLPDGTPLYKMASPNDKDPLEELLGRILQEGQDVKEFKECDIDALTTIIQGAIGEYPLSGSAKKVELEAYNTTLLQVVSAAIKR